MFLERSRNSPLTLDISFPDDHYDPDASPVIDILSQGYHRWYDLSLSIPQGFTRPDLLFPNVRDKIVPALSCLRLMSRRVQSNLNTIGQLFKSCPSLRTLCIEGLAIAPYVSVLPFSQITRVEFWSAHTPLVLQFLLRLPHVQKLCLNYIVRWTGGAEVKHVALPALTSLALSAKSQADIDDLSQYLITPSLETLTISSYPPWRSERLPSWPHWESSAVENLLARSGCSITSLSLESLPITDAQAVTLLQLMPALTSLRIEEPDLEKAKPNRIATSTFFRHLVVDQESHRMGRPGTTFLPLLTSITFKVKAQGLPEEDFFAAVASRWVPDAARAKVIGIECLQSVDVTAVGSGRDPNSALKSLRCFRDAGLRLNVVCQSVTG
ncbi:hypothetical protein AAF712_007193 [Marasmius tenuissimus]|uniref:F-box domain-containing protein n=1 Tax=Marasmius tenuissimus TaxID=585030 RepID=A0ABR2ZYL7_9AGAR